MPILRCTCRHDYQDARYGSSMRVCNPTMKIFHRCTVCGSNVKKPGLDKVKKSDDEEDSKGKKGKGKGKGKK